MNNDQAPTTGLKEAGAEPDDRNENERDRSAEYRDQRADAQDLESDDRDERGAARDQRAEARDERSDNIDLEAASDRAAASRDRRRAATDRRQSADDREAAAGDRVVSAMDRAVSSLDKLTGAYRRDAGTLELERETARAKRNGQSFVLAFVDVDGLKETNDSAGHAAGDRRLHQTVVSMRTQLRSYDLIVRFGGDEFVCGFVDLSMADADTRFEAINVDLEETQNGSITVGLVELLPEDTLDELVGRADHALYEKRALRPSA
ncbi:MAG: hypothetical protein QOG04_632 [Actinomycetota bacterium]|nr:hypothetical protein [Actinomycetota bacterium]